MGGIRKGGDIALGGAASLREGLARALLHLPFDQEATRWTAMQVQHFGYRNHSMNFPQRRSGLPGKSAGGERWLEHPAVKKGIGAQNHLALFRGNGVRMVHCAFHSC